LHEGLPGFVAAAAPHYIYNPAVRFRWNDWNLDHVAEHGIAPEDAEQVVATARQPYPLWRPDDKWLVWGAGRGGQLVQVVFVLDPDDTVFVIHSRKLTDREKQQYRKRRKR
jgi:uncharacterized DUF497 family protein